MKISNDAEYEAAKKRWNEIRDIHEDEPAVFFFLSLSKEFDELVVAISDYEKTLPQLVKLTGVIEAEKQYKGLESDD